MEGRPAASAARTAESIVQTFETWAKRNPSQPAVADGADSLSYRDLNEKANQLARHLQTLGVGPEIPVAIYMQRSTAFVVAILAVLKAGGAYVPLDPGYPPERIEWILNDLQTNVVLSHRWMAAGLKSGSWNAVDLDVDSPMIGRNSTLPPGTKPSSSDLAYIIYTSGSTGQPKGVEISHHNLSSLVSWHVDAFEVNPEDQASQVAGLGFDATVWEVWCCLCAGATLHLAGEVTRRSPEALRDWLVASKVTIAFAPTVMAEHLITLEWPAGTALRYLLTGADTLHRNPPAGLPFTLVNNYGPTECTVLATSGIVPTGPQKIQIPTIGRPIPGARIYVVDEQLRKSPEGEAGELCIAGPGVGRGYRNLPELTASKFVADPFDTAAGWMFRTGDRGKYLPNGEISFLGRMDDQIKIRGFRVEPDEIIAVLCRHSDVQSSAVVLREDATRGAELIAYLVVTPNHSLTSGELREFLVKSLPEYMIPARFVLLQSLPQTPNGKCDKAALPEPDDSNILQNKPNSAIAASEVEQRVSKAVATLVALPTVGRDENFFMLGGHSMLAAQLLARIREAFGVGLTLRHLFESPTVASLTAQVEKALGAGK